VASGGAQWEVICNALNLFIYLLFFRLRRTGLDKKSNLPAGRQAKKSRQTPLLRRLCRANALESL